MSAALPVVTIKPRRALPFFSHHPWVFTGAIGAVSGMPDVGSEVIVRSHEGQFIAYGLFNPSSNLRVRLYSWDQEQRLDDAFWTERVRNAVGFRKKLFADSPSQKACRLIFSEGDGLSGLIVDQFQDYLVVQWTSAALSQRAPVILPVLQETLSPKGIWLRSEKGIREQEGLESEDGLLTGEAPTSPITVEEAGRRFQVDLQAGQKTGFYFDQRDNRSRFADYIHGGRVLDVCTYTGGFAIAAALRGTETQVVGIDSSSTALEMAQSNAELNGVADRIQFERQEMFEALEEKLEAGERFDAIVLDPPKLARTRSGLDRALKAYIRLNKLAMQLLNPDGILMTFSCSGHVLRDDFEQVVSRAALEAKRSVQILEQRGQAADHPVSPHCLESSYLKGLVCRVV